MENIDNIVSGDGKLDAGLLYKIMLSSEESQDRPYADAVKMLENSGILNKESGFGVYANGILSLNPREGGKFGKQLYFSRFIDAENYLNCFQTSEIYISIDRVEKGRRVTSLK